MYIFSSLYFGGKEKKKMKQKKKRNTGLNGWFGFAEYTAGASTRTTITKISVFLYRERAALLQ